MLSEKPATVLSSRVVARVRHPLQLHRRQLGVGSGQPNTRDVSFLSEDEVGKHGAHPYMNLWEGNWGVLWGDYTQGSSSYLPHFATPSPESRRLHAYESLVVDGDRDRDIQPILQLHRQHPG